MSDAPQTRILVIDDDPLDRLAVRRALRHADPPLVIEETASAEEGLAALAERAFDLVFLDFQLPGRDGLWALRAIRERGHDVAVVVLTGQGDERKAVELMKAGATDYVLKSETAPEPLVRVIRNAIRVHGAERATRLATAALHRSEQRLRVALESADLGAWEWDIETGAIAWDARCYALLGVPAGAPIDFASVLRLVPLDDRASLDGAIAAAIAAPRPVYERDIRVERQSDSALRWIRVTASVVVEGGRPARMVGIAQDVTARKEREAEAQRQAEFEQQLIGIVSHDLRNPITAVMMSAGLLLKREETDAYSAKVLARILSSSERAARMIRDLLDLTRARATGGIPVEPRLIGLDAVVKQAVDEIQLGHPDRTIEYQHDGDGEGSWDPDRLAQIVSNLVANAIAYSPPATPVLVATGGTEASVWISVRNEGEPIPTSLLPNLFRPFRRGREGSAAERSIGLGLYIVSQIVAAHGGTIAVDSTAEAGTTFTIELPRCPPGDAEG